MATAAPTQSLPLFYQALEPVSSRRHGNLKIRAGTSVPGVDKAQSVPITVDEFSLVQRFYPIVFSPGEDAFPIALMGLNEGVNTAFDAEGRLIDEAKYVPAYIRRYPFALVRARPDSDRLSLCVDPNSDAIGDFDEGRSLFENGQPGEPVRAALQFCEQFEDAGLRTLEFVQALKTYGLLMDGKVSIQLQGFEQPFVYHGFQQVNEDKFRAMSGDDLRRLSQSGMLPLIYAHLLSMEQMRAIFLLQLDQGKIPPMRAGRFSVHTTALQDPPPGSIPLEIPASLAFGTGRHVTTSQCLEELDALERSGARFKNVADVGTGTGLLAYAALALWPKARCLATDIDPAAIDAARDIAAINKVKVGDGPGKLVLEVADGMNAPAYAERAPFDLIIANILAGPLTELAPDIAKSLAPGGTVILAGLIHTQADAVIAAYEQQGLVLKSRTANDWPVLVLNSPPKA